MIKRRKSPDIYFGWWTVLITSIWSGLGSGFDRLGISVFFKPIAADLHLSRAAASVAAGVGKLEGGLESPLTGWLSDRFGPRWVILIGTFIAATGLALMTFVDSLWAYILVWGIIIGFGNNLAFTLAMDKALTNWFVRKRGLALGTRFVLVGTCGVIILPIVTWLVTEYDWRTTCLIWSVILFAGLPFLWYFVKQKRPEYYGLLPDGAKIGEETADINQMIDKGAEYAAEAAGEVEFTLRQTLKTPSYWLLAIGSCGGTILQSAITIHLIPFLTDMGFDAVAASGMMATMVFFQIPARFLSAFLCDRLQPKYWNFLLAATIAFQVAAVTVIILNQSIAAVYVFLILFGFGSGAVIITRVMIESRYFGRKAFGSIHGATNVFQAPIGLSAPIFAGWIFDTSGSYVTAFIAFGAFAALATFLVCLLRPPKPPAEVTDISKFM